MTVKNIKDWENIFLDTSVIFNLLHSKRTGCKDTTSLFVGRLIEYLSKTNSSNGKKRYFFISAISISEIWNKRDKDKRIKEIITAINSEDVTVVSFSHDIAEYMNQKYHPILNKKELNKIAKSLSWPEHDLVNGREWLLKDVMIIASSDHFPCDVLLTADINTMASIAQKLDVFAAVTFERFFNTSETHILGYEKSIADKETAVI